MLLDLKVEEEKKKDEEDHVAAVILEITEKKGRVEACPLRHPDPRHHLPGHLHVNDSAVTGIEEAIVEVETEEGMEIVVGVEAEVDIGKGEGREEALPTTPIKENRKKIKKKCFL